jgi:hypothetical protein
MTDIRSEYPAAASRREANPLRLCVARNLGRAVDGAWWPRAERLADELPRLVKALTPLIGRIKLINVNWPPRQDPPDFNWVGWKYRRQHVMSVCGDFARVNLLVISYATHSALALMVLRRAADLPVHPEDRDTPAFLTAGMILFAAQQQCGADELRPGPYDAT